jgi:putative FmdB family regulatory protein
VSLTPLRLTRARKTRQARTGNRGEPHTGCGSGNGEPPSALRSAGTLALRVPRAFPILGKAMPIYEYRCEHGHTFEVMQRMTDDPVSVCSTCDAPVERVFHPVAVHFKGSGFYTTDYGKRKRSRDSGDSDSSGESKSEKDSKSDGKSETKSEAKSETKTAASSSSD